ncbi:HEAT repeat domain-containing protein [Streptomyces collinus]|uniref:HEAT repeat domain-containing protein n=1 Tax=Streptomyces collinus TaxID=42684 RepID=UPI0033E1C2E7
MTRSADRDEEAGKALGQFLQGQSRAAGLTTRDIEQRFQQRADQERARIEAGQARPLDLVNGMRFSKSHLDRLFKGATAPPSKRFVTMFLEITSSTIGMSPAQHQELCRKADELLTAAHRYRRHIRTEQSVAPTSPVSPEVSVAALQLQVELERAHRIEDRLRWALSDAQLLMTTLLQIISSLREIIVDLDTKQVQALHRSTESFAMEAATGSRQQALLQKATAESQLARVNERRLLLETLWEQAHANVRRLSQHPDVPKIETLPTGPALPQHEIPPFSAQAPLDDIAAALIKAEEINIAEDRKTHEWQEKLSPTTVLESADEQAILLAATRLTDAENRRTALDTLIKKWRHSLATRNALFRLTCDEHSDIRKTATRALGRDWSDDDAARQAVITTTRDPDPKVQAVAVWVLTESWRGSSSARDALVALTRDDSDEARETAIEGLAEGWPGDKTAREAIVRLTYDPASRVRETAVEALVESWPGDVSARDALLNLVHSDDISLREAAAASLCVGWPGDPSVTAAFLELQHDDAPIVRWVAERGLIQEGHPLSNSPDEISEMSNQRNLTSRRQRANSIHRGTLIASRVPYDFSTEKPLEAILALRRGISFDPGINVVTGRNASGKTILLMALALHIGAVDWRQITSYKPSLALQVANNLELLWHSEPLPEDCFYLNRRLSDAKRLAQLEHTLSKEGKYRLYLLDEPTGAWDQEMTKSIFSQMSKLAQQGCQFIISTSDIKRVEVTDGKLIRLGRRRIRERGNILSW